VKGNEPAASSRARELAPVSVPRVFCVGACNRAGGGADAVRLPAGTVHVLTSGIAGLTPTGALPETFEAEAQQAWVNVRKALLAAGACLRDVVSVRAWLTEAADIPAYERATGWFLEHDVVSSLVVVNQLRRPDLRVEVDVVATPPALDP
jgi:enamine deaminase RidA (YjgF/YER057c/UK114 family)